MTDTAVLEIALRTMIITAKLATPILAVSLAIGVGVSLIQTVTQVQEFTLTFVPKIAGVGIVVLITGRWMLQELVVFTHQMFSLVPQLVGSGG
ncbi:MAG TPA: flagellar biosynthetic protein FliQ [Acidimicrobiia bacterium]|nr:flagellar biosynthetic protein FliQ [Acidimicrobiia bacterium]